jgi:arylsulfatase A-like enzyme
VPAMVKWPGHIAPGQISNQMVSGLDWFPTLLAAAGDTDVKTRLLNGWQPSGSSTTFKNHLDGYNQLDYITGRTDKSARKDFYYFDDDGELVATRYDDWKVVFKEQPAPGGFAVWQTPLITWRLPKLFNLRMDPYERADIVSDQYNDWLVRNDYLLVKGQLQGAAFLETFVKYPPSQRVASFNIEGVRAQVDKAIDQSFKDRGVEK